MIHPAAGEGQWVLTALDKNIDEGTADKSYSSSISYDIGEIRITKEHSGLPGYRPYVQKSIMTWSPMPTAAAPGENIKIEMKVSDGGSTAEYRNSGILSFSLAGERDYDFIASKYRGMEQVAEYTMPQGAPGDEIFIKIEGSMGTKDLPSAQYIYTYEYMSEAVPLIPVKETSGKVILNTRGVVIPAASATLMKKGDVLLTGPDGKATISLQDGGEVHLDKNTAAGIIEAGAMAVFMGRMHVDSFSGFELVIGNSRPDPADQYLIYRLQTSIDDVSHLVDAHNSSGLYMLRGEAFEFTVLVDNGSVEASVIRTDSEFEGNSGKMSIREGETLFAAAGGDIRVEPSVRLDEWWRENPAGNTEKRGSPAFEAGLSAAAMLLAFLLGLKRY